MKNFWKRAISFVLAVLMFCGSAPQIVSAMLLEKTEHIHEEIIEEEPEEIPDSVSEGTELPDFFGKKVSILGDSISTYTGISNNAKYNSTLNKNIGFYPANDVTEKEETWWQQVIDALGMELCVNNSSGGGRVLSDEKLSTVSNGNFTSALRNIAAYKDRCVNLHNANGEKPDVIFVFMGTNDFSYCLNTEYCETCKKLAECEVCKGTNSCENCITFSGLNPSFCTQGLGSSDINENLIEQNQDGTFTYNVPETTCEAYAIMLHKIKQEYPDAEIFCMGLLARRNPDYQGGYHDHGQPTEFNGEIRKIAESFGATFVDLENCGINKSADEFDSYIYDKAVHPNASGMDKITEAVISAMLREEVKVYDVSVNLTEANFDGKRIAVSGSEYKAWLTAKDDYTGLDVTVTMGGNDVTASVYANGVISIPSVTGNIVITVSGTGRESQNFRWEFDGTGLLSKGEDENVPEKLSGSISGEMFLNTRYKLERPIVLRHDLPWIFEWEGEGTGGFMLAEGTETNDGNKYFFHRSNNTLEAFGYWNTEQSMNNNYGVSLKDIIDTGKHKYRAENRISSDGNNMVYLTVDGEKEYRLDNLFYGGNDQNVKGDWINGKDFVFNYIGTNELPLTNYRINYLSVWESGKPSLEGKTFSILGASISTYAGTSNGAAADTTNSTIRNNAKYYPHSVVKDVTLNDTWWMQVANDLGLRLLVNNSWSGSTLLHERSGTVGAYVDRCVQLHDDTGENAGETPDIIGIQMGSNDFQYYKETLGTADIDYSVLIKENGDGTFTYAEPETSLEAAAIVLHKISVRYPNAEVYYLNISQRIDGTDAKIFNTELEKVVEYFGANIVDIYGSVITPETFDTHIGDGRVHPNKLGMDAYTEAFKRAVLANTAYEAETHLVSFELESVSADYGDDKIVISGDSFNVNLSSSGDVLEVSVTMGGKDITEAAYKNGKVSIESVTGDVIIKAKSVHEPKDYRFEFNGTDLVCVSGGNALGKISGTTTDGFFNKTAYSLEKPVILMHDYPWTVEWKSEGTFMNENGSTGARIFTSDNINANYNARYIFKSAKQWLIAMGEKDKNGSHNYGIALENHGIDGSAPHIYRLENRISEDGSNMIWLFVDGKEIGPMNNYYVGTTDKNTTSDWLSGKDFAFPYMGTDTHGFSNAKIDYIAVWEGGKPSFEGKKVSILGDSISTYTGVSNNTDYNSTIGKNAVYYSEGRLGVYRKDTWWQQAIDTLGMELCVNNSWSGSCVFSTRSGTVGAYVDRAVQLHNDKTGEEPDIIAVYLGTNDFTNYKSTLGTAEAVDYSKLITENSGTYTYANPATACEAYAIMLHKASVRYPKAEIYCFTLLPRLNQSSSNIQLAEQFNASIEAIAEHFGASVVDLYNESGIKADENFGHYVGDNSLHPGPYGMDALTGCFLSSLYENSAYNADEVYKISYELDDVFINEGTAYAIAEGRKFECNIKYPSGYEVAVSVKMGEKDITESVYKEGKITISAVTGDIEIFAKAKMPEKEPENYRFEFNGTELVNTTENGFDANALTRIAGSVTNGVHSKSRFKIEKEIVLYHNKPWTIEWKSEGNWTDSAYGALLFAGTEKSATADNTYIYRRHNSDFIAMGVYSGGNYHNYGVSLKNTGIDATVEHVYKFENRIDENGANMVYLSVDGKEIGSMNHYWVGGTDQNKESNWISGKDFVFKYMGTDPHTIGNCSIDYISVWENGHEHAYKGTSCSICGLEHPNAANYEGKVISILGDSISTFAGYIPVADGFNLEHRARYPQSNLLTDVNLTWWMQTLSALDAKLGINDSWAGSRVLNTQNNNSGDLGPDAAMASLTRIQNLGANGTPDIILFYGGTNDITKRSDVGTFSSETAPTEVDLTSTKWENVADAYVAAIMRMQYYYPDAEIIAMLPTFTSKNTDAVIEEYNSVFKEICEHYGVKYTDLRDCGITTANLPDGTHPNAIGMDYITDAVIGILMDVEIESGENIVYSISHELENVKASLGYYKGISAGKAFSETLEGENLSVSVTMGGRDITENVYKDGRISISAVTEDVVVTANGKEKPVYADYLQSLPEKFCAGTNLWKVLKPENIYYTASGWGIDATGLVHSVTVPVSAGERIWATSFQKAGLNGGNGNGIRITWFDENNVLKTMNPNSTYSEFSTNGFITAPEGAVAVNIPMWNNSDENELYIFSAEHEYKGTSCSICGLEHPNAANYEGKVISILGDSISTFAGYIPVADGFNLEHLARYPQDNLLTDVNETWWMQIINEFDAKLGINDSWRGSTVSGYPSVTTGVAGYLAAMSNPTQIQNLGSNGTPDVILFYGGTNDLAHTPKLGEFDPETAPKEAQFETLKWDNLADGYCNAILRLRYFYPDAEIIAMFPTFTKSYYTNDKLAQGNALLAEICEHYGIKYVDLRYCGISVSDLPDGIHPDAKGMDYITDAVIEILLEECETEAGENTVYTVKHDLDGAKASKSYYKGVSAGKTFEETLEGENLSVKVTMGGKDITAEVYKDGKIEISSVLGDIVITVVGEKEPVYAGYIQELPEDYYGKNLWKILEHNEEYYTVSGWGKHSSGKVRSVTFEVEAGEKIYASSFEKAGVNGTAGTNGIRITFFDENEVLVSKSADSVYAEFSEKGYITVPEGAKAVNVPMWTDSADWELYVYDSSYEPGFSLGEHLQELPEEFCCGTNLWTMLKHEHNYHNGTEWTYMETVYSVTVPIEEGDKLWATSFAEKGKNGNNTYDGIRVTFFGEKGVVVSLTHTEVFEQFTKNGFVTAPEGAVAVNIPMWNNSDENELYILNREHDYESVITEPTCTEQGYTTHTCSVCGDSYVDSYVEPKGHSFSENKCELCGIERIRVYAEDIVRYQGGVDAGTGILNTTFTNNWYSDIYIPEGAEKVSFLTFKTGGNWGSAFTDGNSFISGYADKTTGGQWVTIDVPEKADVFRYGYLYDSIADKNGYPRFEYVEFLGQNMEPVPESEYMKRPATGCHSFSVKVNIASALGEEGYVEGTDYGYIMLPTSYRSFGEATRLIIVCHGASAKLSNYQSDEWKENNYSFWTELGYAVMDMYACPKELSGDGSELHYGNPSVLECYKAGYDYVMKNFNLKKDGIFVIGSSMGGLSSFRLVQSEGFPVIAQVAYCPVTDMFKQAYCNPWTTASYQRSRIAQYFGFEGTKPQFTNGKFPSDAEIGYFRENLEKVMEYSPLYKGVVSGNVDVIFGVTPNFAVGFSEAEEELYGKLTAEHPCPVMIFHNLDDSVVSYRYSEYFKEMVERSGQKVILHTFETGGHNAYDNGSSVSVQGINKTLNLSVSKYKAYEFFKGIEDHSEHYSWVDPAVAPTCTETGLTEGSHCAYCGEILVKQNVVPALGHTEVIDRAVAPTCTETGLTEGKHCSVCGEILVKQESIDAHGHIYSERCDKTCNICGTEREIYHDKDKLWSADAENHWHACTCCKTAFGTEKHNFIDGICSVCTYEKRFGREMSQSSEKLELERLDIDNGDFSKEGYFNEKTGELISSSGYRYSEKYYDISGAKKLFLGYTNGVSNNPSCPKVFFYDVNYKYISMEKFRFDINTENMQLVQGYYGNIINIPENAEYARFATTKATTHLVHYFKVSGDYVWKDNLPSVNTLRDKTIVFFGDSIIGNHREADNSAASVTQLLRQFGAETINAAFGGTWLSERNNSPYGAFSMVELAESVSKNNYSKQFEGLSKAVPPNGHMHLASLKNADWENVDYIIIAQGTNDFNSNVIIDNNDPYAKNTIKGALRFIIETINNKYPHIQIVLCTVNPRFKTEDNGDGTYSYLEYGANKKGNTLGDYANAFNAVAEEYDLVCVDLYNNSFSLENAETYFNLKDGTHPNLLGRWKIAEKIVEELGHNYEPAITLPTCTEQGYTTHTCSVCGDSYVDSYVEATGHSFGEWYTVTEATPTEPGEERRDCKNCEHYETQEIPPKGYEIGDINLDGKVDVMDAYYIRLVVAKLRKPTEQQILLGDVDGDGRITAIDANIIRKFAVKMITELPVK